MILLKSKKIKCQYYNGKENLKDRRGWFFSGYCCLLFSGIALVFSGCAVIKGTTKAAWGVTKVGTKAAWKTAAFVGKGVKTTVNIIGGKTVVPLHRQGNSMFVSTRINGRVHTALLVDTGANRTQISLSLAKRLGINLKHAEPIIVRTADGREVEALQINLKEVRIGRAVVKDVPAVVLVNGQDKGYDGLLGMSFLNEFIFQIDSQKGELILQKRMD